MDPRDDVSRSTAADRDDVREPKRGSLPLIELRPFAELTHPGRHGAGSSRSSSREHCLHPPQLTSGEKSCSGNSSLPPPCSAAPQLLSTPTTSLPGKTRKPAGAASRCSRPNRPAPD